VCGCFLEQHHHPWVKLQRTIHNTVSYYCTEKFKLYLLSFPKRMIYVTSVIKKMLPVSTDHADGAHINSVLLRCHKIHQKLTAVFLPLVITTMIFSCFWAYIQGASAKYDNPSAQWQACLTVPNNLEVPLSQTLAIGFDQVKTTLGTAIAATFTCPGKLPQCSDSTYCVGNITQTCFVPLIVAAQSLSAPDVANIEL
jgi:hypothetical protein